MNVNDKRQKAKKRKSKNIGADTKPSNNLIKSKQFEQTRVYAELQEDHLPEKKQKTKLEKKTQVIPKLHKESTQNPAMEKTVVQAPVFREKNDGIKELLQDFSWAMIGIFLAIVIYFIWQFIV